MRFLYYLAAFGSPNFELKLSYLKNNLEYIYNNIGEKFDIIVNNYDVEKQQIQLKYSKVQSFTTLPLRMLIKINESSYIEVNNTSVVNTFNYLFGDKILSTTDVKYHYK